MNIQLKLTLDEVQTECFERLLLTNIISLGHQMQLLETELGKEGLTEVETENLKTYLQDCKIQLKITTDIAHELENRPEDTKLIY